MLRSAIALLLSTLMLSGIARADAPPARVAVLARGLDISHWFRFPPNNAASAMAHDLDDAAIASLKGAGFTFIRLPVGPEEVMQGGRIDAAKREAIVAVIGRLEKAGLAVLVDPNPELMQHWNLQQNQAAQAELLAFWRDLAPALRRLPVGLTFPELVNEPMFKDPAQWDVLQRKLLAVIRASLPRNTVILTGTDWSSIDGLLRVQPVADTNVIYSFHTYEPQLLALLGFWDPAIRHAQFDRAVPFPVDDVSACRRQVAVITDAHTRSVAEYWCSLHQDAATVKKNLARAAAWGSAHGVSVAMTEFGAAGAINPQARQNLLAAMRTGAEQLHLPWALWALDDQMGFGQQPGAYRSAAQLSPLVMHALGLSPTAGFER